MNRLLLAITAVQVLHILAQTVALVLCSKIDSMIIKGPYCIDGYIEGFTLL